ncbi:hypothetical protein G6F50_014791 [Rhizopus delemar]|uniref:Uncharacterized protein n=1 Tax=Rhizopus delemar TaxID=936053 RepID=A0A9P7C5V1_9FUNG|nr:hypothetical protein G6F50_014791 [Rhizopus delemar]
MVFYLSYFFLALPSSWILRRTGMKKGLSLSLLVMAGGAALFGEFATQRWYPGALGGLFVIGRGLALLQVRTGHGLLRLRLLRVLHGAGAVAGQFAVALLVGAGQGQFGAADIDTGPGLFDQRALLGQCGLCIGQLCTRVGQVGTRCLQGHLVVAVVDARQHVAGLHGLVVVHLDAADEAGHLRCDYGEIRIDVGVVARPAQGRC